MVVRNTDRVREILSSLESDNPGTKTNMARLLNPGRLAGVQFGAERTLKPRLLINPDLGFRGDARRIV